MIVDLAATLPDWLPYQYEWRMPSRRCYYASLLTQWALENPLCLSKVDSTWLDLTRCEACGAFHIQETAMLENLERKMLLAELEGVLSKLRDQGIEPGLTDEEIETLDVKSLREAVRRFEKLARTPGGR